MASDELLTPKFSIRASQFQIIWILVVRTMKIFLASCVNRIAAFETLSLFYIVWTCWNWLALLWKLSVNTSYPFKINLFDDESEKTEEKIKQYIYKLLSRKDVSTLRERNIYIYFSISRSSHSVFSGPSPGKPTDPSKTMDLIGMPIIPCTFCNVRLDKK